MICFALFHKGYSFLLVYERYRTNRPSKLWLKDSWIAAFAALRGFVAPMTDNFVARFR